MTTTKQYISTRALTRSYNKLSELDNLVIVMNHSKPKNIVLPYTDRLLAEVEKAIARISLQDQAQRGLHDIKNRKTKSLAQVEKMFLKK